MRRGALEQVSRRHQHVPEGRTRIEELPMKEACATASARRLELHTYASSRAEAVELVNFSHGARASTHATHHTPIVTEGNNT